ncbi:universal stress protein [Janthinobacterium sp. J1-1]|uniref:universal stress protein n=1 Tax=Janthinobacterium sp. J1-1 TaxID=3065910 RepID=UPI002811040B|nr:universal stress protein [Janthinobacterium sp. J1-1]
MSYRTIVVHCDQSRHAAARYALATWLACATDAHLAGVAATGLSHHAQWNAQSGAGPLLRNVIAQRRQQASEALDSFAHEACAMGVGQWSRWLEEDDAEGALQRHARYADLLILSQSDAYDVLRGIPRPLPSELLFHTARPLLLLPASHGTPATLAARSSLLAWDGSMQAARAMTDALPLLRLSAHVTVLMLNGGHQPSPDGIEPGAAIANYLARHAVQVRLMREVTAGDIGAMLLSVAAAQDCGLLVMGAYRHRRVQEMLLGGATRTVLRGMTLPVLVAH